MCTYEVVHVQFAWPYCHWLWNYLPWTCKFYWIIVVQRNNLTVLHVLNPKLHTMLLVVYSSANAIFITILSFVAKLSPFELVNFTKSLLSRAPAFLQVLLWNLHIMFVCIWSFAYAIFMSICPSVHGHNFVRSYPY